MSATLTKQTRLRLECVVPLVLDWYANNKRDFPWRTEERDTYLHFISEYMLQQTGAAHVVNRLPRFLDRFPSIAALANASTEDVIAEWQGLGYNRRALNLHRAAKMLDSDFGGELPRTLVELQSLPGIGLYTASAILSFAFEMDVPVVDVNIQRVLSRVWRQMETAREVLPLRDILLMDESIMPRGRSGEWHQALMDLGSMICTKSNPKCSACPVVAYCESASALGSSAARDRATPPSNEPYYFGAPRRLWRGRVLKLIAENSSRTSHDIISSLEQKWNVSGDEFESFVRGILVTLAREGFIHRAGLHYHLGTT